MIACVDIEVQAANPNLPLPPMRAYIGSPSSIRLRNVPRRIGDWCIRSVQFVVVYPDGAIKTAECVLTGGVWVGTVEGTSTNGTSTNGYTIFASGTDENGATVTGYVLGKGDVEIMDADGTLNPGEIKYYVHMLSAESSTPKEGDLWRGDDDAWYIYQDGQAWPVGDDSGLINQLSAEVQTKADLSAIPTVHGDYIVDADGNTISANLRGKQKSQTYVWQTHWIPYNKDYTLTGTYDSAEYYPTVPTDTDNLAFEIRVFEGSGTAQGYNDFVLNCYRWENGEWIGDSNGTAGDIPVDGTHFKDDNWIADWTAELVDVQLATESYVESRLGDVSTILHNM